MLQSRLVGAGSPDRRGRRWASGDDDPSFPRPPRRRRCSSFEGTQRVIPDSSPRLGGDLAAAAGEDRAPAGAKTLRWIRVWIAILMAGLVVSGITAFPLREELAFASTTLHGLGLDGTFPGIVEWVDRVAEALATTYAAFPFIAYGTDWPAFAPLVIAAAFIGPFRDPVRNIWVLQWGAAPVPRDRPARPDRGVDPRYPARLAVDRHVVRDRRCHPAAVRIRPDPSTRAAAKRGPSRLDVARRDRRPCRVAGRVRLRQSVVSRLRSPGLTETKSRAGRERPQAARHSPASSNSAASYCGSRKYSPCVPTSTM